jgi:hypothetical protein
VKPEVSYRYAFFGGDDPGTSDNEAFDPLFLGFSGWGAWWQGEIMAVLPLQLNNISHQLRVHLSPVEPLSCG